jgi:hypothetical protein
MGMLRCIYLSDNYLAIKYFFEMIHEEMSFESNSYLISMLECAKQKLFCVQSVSHHAKES